MFGTTTDREKHDEYLAHFFKEIDRGLHKVLGADTAPLLLCGVEYETALYRKTNTYHHLMEHDLHGSPDGMSLQQLHERSLEIVQTGFCAPLDKVMREFGSYRNGNRVLTDLHAIVASAAKGRVSHLLLREGPEDRKRNLAALQTLLHGGEAYTLKDNEMPDHAGIAAVIRYQVS